MEDEEPRKRKGKGNNKSGNAEAAQADLENRIQKFTEYLLDIDQAYRRSEKARSRGEKGAVNGRSAVRGKAAASVRLDVSPPYARAVLDGGSLHSGHRARLRKAAYYDRALDGFRDTELLELLLSFAVPRRDTNPIAHALLDAFGSVQGALKASVDELARVRGMTENAARLIAAVSELTLRHRIPSVAVCNHFRAVEFFGAVYLGGGASGTYAACIDFCGRLVGVELCSAGDEIICARDVINAVFRKNTRAVMLVRRSPDIFPDNFGVAPKVRALRNTLEQIGVMLLDFIMFTDYGYYTLGKEFTEGDWQVKYVFIPYSAAMSAPALLDIFARGGKLPPTFDIEQGSTGVISEFSQNITLDLFNCIHADENGR